MGASCAPHLGPLRRLSPGPEHGEAEEREAGLGHGGAEGRPKEVLGSTHRRHHQLATTRQHVDRHINNS